jgi:hypothetical protein
MTIETAQLQMFAVQMETFGCELRFAKTHARVVLIDDVLSFRQSNCDLIELWLIDIPKLDVVNIIQRQCA